MTPADKKAFDLMSADIVDLTTEIDGLKNPIGDYDQKRFDESKAKLLIQIDDEKEQF